MKGNSSRRGDRGLTSLGDGTPIGKASARVEAYGSVDEMDSFAGLARVEVLESLDPSPERDLIVESIDTVQTAAWLIGASLASPSSGVSPEGFVLLASMDGLIARLEEAAGPIHSFVIPGTMRAEALLHVARAVCRRAERNAVALSGVEEGTDGATEESAACGPECALLNRTSRLLFAAARLALKCGGKAERYRGRP